MEIVPLHIDASTNPAGWGAVERGVDFDAAIEMNRPHAQAVIAEWLEAQGPERRLFLSKHRGDLSLRGAMNARVRPVRVPAIEIGLRVVECLEAEASEGRLLRVPDPGFDFSFAIGIRDATGQSDDAVVREHVWIQRIQRRIVDVGREHALFEIIEDDHADTAAEPTEGAFMELRPDPRA